MNSPSAQELRDLMRQLNEGWKWLQVLSSIDAYCNIKSGALRLSDTLRATCSALEQIAQERDVARGPR